MECGMKRIVLVSTLALALAGCNATVRPAVDVYVPAPPRQPVEYYAPAPPPRPYFEPARPRLVIPPQRCAVVWENYRGQYVERRVCGHHIP